MPGTDVVRSVRVQFDTSGVIRGLTEQSTTSKTATDSIRKLADENGRAVDSYRKTVAAIDPAAAAELKYSAAARTLDDSLRRGIVTQQEHVNLIAKAHAKYLEAGEGPTKFGQLISKVTELTELGGHGIEEMGSKLGGLSTKTNLATVALGELEGMSTKALIGIGALAGGVILLAGAFEGLKILKEIIQEGIKTQDINDQLEASLKANGSAAGYSSAELIKLAQSLVNVSGRTKDEIVQTETVLSRYKELGRDIYPRVIQATLDYAQSTNKGPIESARLLGPLLEGNARSLNRVKDVGIDLSAKQRAHLQDMIDNNQLIEYQSTILGLLEGHIKGAAKAHAETLGGGLDIANSKFTLLKENIAGQVIPILQDMLSSTVKASGGWGEFDKNVEEVGKDVGTSIKYLVAGIIISYHDISEGTHQLAADFSAGWEKIVKIALGGASNITAGLSLLPSALGGGDQWLERSKAIDQYAASVTSSLEKDQKAWRKEADEQHKANELFIAGLADQKSALEGSDKVHGQHARNEDEIAKKVKGTDSALRSAAEATRAYTDKLSDLNTKEERLLASEQALAKAALISANVYNLEKDAQDKANYVATKTQELFQAHRTEIEKLTAARDQLAKAHDPIDAAKIQSDINKANVAYDSESAKLKQIAASAFDAKLATAASLAINEDAATAAHDLAKAEAELADAKSQSTIASENLSVQLEIESRIRKLKPNSSTDIIAIVLETNALHNQIQARKDQKTATESSLSSVRELDALHAHLADELERTQVLREWGSEIESIYSKYNLLDNSSKNLKIHLEALSDSRVKAHTATVEEIELELRLQQLKIDQDNQESALIEVNRVKTLQFLSVLESGFSAIADILGNTDSKIGKLATDLGGLVSAISKVEQSGKAFSAAWTQAMAGAIASSETLLKDLNVGGADKTGGSSALGGRLESNYAGTGSIIGSIIGGIIAGIVSEGTATGVGVSLGGAIGGVLGSLISKAGDSASAHLTASGNIVVGEVSHQLAGSIFDALTNIFKSLKEELASLGLQLEGVPLIDIKVRDNIVRVVVGSVVRTFSSMSDAISFGIAEAVKQAATSGGHLPPEVLAALKNTTATNMQQLQSDIDFAMKIANYGVPQVAQALSKSLSDFYVEMEKDVELGINTTKSIANLGTVIQQQKDQILGINRTKSPQDQLRADVAAFNERASLIRAQDQIDLANNQLKRADLQQQIALLKALAQVYYGHGELAKARITTDANVDMASASSLGLLLGALAAVDNAIAVEQAILDHVTLITDQELADALKRLAKVGKGAGKSGVDDAQSIRDALEQTRISLLGQEGQALANINSKYEELNKKVAKNADLTSQLAKAKQAEIDALSKQITTQYITPYSGSQYAGDRSDYSKQLADIKLAETDLTSNAAALKLSLSDISSAFAEQSRELGLQVASDLGIDSASLDLQYQKLGQSISFLRDHMEELGISSTQLADYLSQLSDTTELSIFGKISQYITNEQILANYKEVQYELDIARAKEELSLAYAAGTITLEAYNRLGSIVYSLPDTIPTDLGSSSSSYSSAAQLQSSAASTQLQAAQTASDTANKLTQWQQSLLTSPDISPLSPRAQVEAAQQQLSDLLSKALSGDTTAQGNYTSTADTFLKLYSSTFGKTGAYGEQVYQLSANADRIKAILSNSPTTASTTYASNLGYSASGSGGVDNIYHSPLTTGAPPPPPPRGGRNPTDDNRDLEVIRHLNSVDDRLGSEGDLYKIIRDTGSNTAIYQSRVLEIHRKSLSHLENIATETAQTRAYLQRVIEAMRNTSVN